MDIQLVKTNTNLCTTKIVMTEEAIFFSKNNKITFEQLHKYLVFMFVNKLIL